MFYQAPDKEKSNAKTLQVGLKWGKKDMAGAGGKAPACGEFVENEIKKL